MIALVDARPEGLGGRDRELHFDFASVELARDLEPRVAENPEHRCRTHRVGSTSYTTCDQVTDLTSICIITAAALAAVLFLA